MAAAVPSNFERKRLSSQRLLSVHEKPLSIIQDQATNLGSLFRRHAPFATFFLKSSPLDSSDSSPVVTYALTREPRHN